MHRIQPGEEVPYKLPEYGAGHPEGNGNGCNFLKAVRDLIIVLSVMGKATVYAGFDTIF